ncbi:hypothetical protein GEV33_000162 [Tenebrio molitor]|uniref:Uncharacterized protein n=1 Tax=Tenebrio molitor TaxID=7067 RepID=A0A8J6HXH0_TENMO|nr:hypothetical protein GEV33_000162 [Tenebrio molitor]
MNGSCLRVSGRYRVSLNNKPNGVLSPGRSGFRPAGDGLHPRRCRGQSPLGYNVAHSLFESTGSGAIVHHPVPKIENPGQQEYLSSPNLAVTNLILGNVEVRLAFNGREHLPSTSCRQKVEPHPFLRRRQTKPSFVVALVVSVLFDVVLPLSVFVRQTSFVGVLAGVAGLSLQEIQSLLDGPLAAERVLKIGKLFGDSATHKKDSKILQTDEPMIVNNAKWLEV